MLEYLNNEDNRRPEVLEDGTIVGYNENYARELLELHTVGVDGGYTERDVVEATRILTGWGRTTDDFAYRHTLHDVEAKSIMGVEYPAGGDVTEGIAFLEFLANHASTASFVGGKLCVRFVGEDPPASALAGASNQFRQTSGDLGSTMATILNGPEFINADTAHFRSKVKPPHRFVASALMAMGAQAASDWSAIEATLVTRIIDSGDTPYFFPPPTGYPENAEFWLAPPSLLVRFEMAESIAYEPRLRQLLRDRAGVDGSDISATFAAVQPIFLPGGISGTTQAAVQDHAAANAVTNDQRLSAIAHMLLVSPEFLRY